MNSIEVSAEFYGDQARSEVLLAKVGPTGHVEFNASTGVSRVKISRTGEGDLLEESQASIARLKALVDEVRDPDIHDVFNVTIHAEELIARAGNQHRRGEIVE